MTGKRGHRQIEMLLEYDGGNWILSNEQISITASELEDLDRALESSLKQEWKKGPLEVFMKTDDNMIPEWIRPYMNHYFNRILELPLKY